MIYIPSLYVYHCSTTSTPEFAIESFSMPIETSSAFLVLLVTLLSSFMHCSLSTDDLFDFIEDRRPILEDSEWNILLGAVRYQI